MPNGRPSWLAPPVMPGATIRSPAGNPPGTMPPGFDSGNAGWKALHEWPLMPDNQPQNQSDIANQQPWRLRQARRISQSFANIPMIGGSVDWMALLSSLFSELLAHIDEKVFIIPQPFTVGTVAVSVRPEESRRYLFILNTSAAAQNLFIGFGSAPTGAATDFVIPAGSFYEPGKIPQNEIFLLGSAATTTGQIFYAN